MLCQEKQLDTDSVTTKTQDSEISKKDDSWCKDNSTEVVEKNGKIGLVINVCFGDFDFSKEGKTALIERGVKTHPDYIKRTNKILINLIEEGKVQMNNLYSSLQIEYIDKKYFDGEGFWKINEYDGWEDIEIDYRAYNLWKKEQAFETFRIKIGQILDAGQDSDEKIKHLRSLLGETL